MSIFRQRATGSVRLPDLDEVRRALSLLADPNYWFEIRTAPSWRSYIFKGSDLDGLCRAVSGTGDQKAVYFALNPLKAGAERAKVETVVCRRWFLIDADPVKAEPDGNATDSEKDAARLLAHRVLAHLTALGWPAPLMIDSGNGWHLLYRVDLPNDKLTHALLKKLSHDLADKFDTPEAIVDRKVHNASRISKLPGTWVRKGPNTKERPHRLSRIEFVPEDILVVPVELLQPAGGDGATLTAPSFEQSPFKLSAGKDSRQQYARKALQLELAAVALAPERERNNTLNASSFSLGQLIAAGLLNESEVEGALYFVARRVGLDESEILPTIRSGIGAGKQQPRVLPEKLAKQSTNGTTTATSPADDKEPLTVSLANVTPQRVEWLMHHRLPKRFVTVFAGRTGAGKSFVACDLIARMSVGGEVPLQKGELFETGGTLIISEDSHEYVLAPRLIELGADLSKIRAMTWKAMGRYHLGDIAMLERAYKETNEPRLVMIDPPTNFLGDVDEHKNSEVRQTVMKVVEWTFSHDLACLFILHVNKNSGNGIDALNRVLGSVAWVTTARIAHSFCSDPDDKSRCLFVPLKNNLGPLAKALAYRVTKTDSLAKVEWLEEVDISADDAMAGSQNRQRKRNVIAADWLEKIFESVDQLPSKEIWDRQKTETSLSDNALKEGKDLLGIRAHRDKDPDGKECWMWLWTPEARARWAEHKAKKAAQTDAEDEEAL